GVVAAGGLLCFAHDLADVVFQAPHLAAALRAAAALMLFSALTRVQTGILMGLGDFRTVALLGIVRGAILFVALVVGIWRGGVMGGVLGLVLTEGFAVAANHLALTRHFPRRGWGGRGNAMAGEELRALCRFSGLAVL